jgi:hypothetical protein
MLAIRVQYSSLFVNQPSLVPLLSSYVLRRGGYKQGGVRGCPKLGHDMAVTAFRKSEAKMSAATCDVTARDDDPPAPLDKGWTDVCTGGRM